MKHALSIGVALAAVVAVGTSGATAKITLEQCNASDDCRLARENLITLVAATNAILDSHSGPIGADGQAGCLKTATSARAAGQLINDAELMHAGIALAVRCAGRGDN